MKKGDKFLSPMINFTDTRANIEATPNPVEGMTAQQTDSPYAQGRYANGAWVWGSTGGGTPGGSDTQIQFNTTGTFDGDADLTYNKSTNLLTISRYSSSFFR